MFVVQEQIHADVVSRHETLEDAMMAIHELTASDDPTPALAVREVDDAGRTVRVVPAAPREVRPQLTPRERQVLMLLNQGLTNLQIAERLDISPTTVKVHVRHALAKLGVRGPVHA
jgi:DNA-binding NarL/FixJ family response regulator